MTLCLRRPEFFIAARNIRPLQRLTYDPLALMMMVMVQDAWGQKNLKRAEACYRRLSEMKEPKPRFTGMYMQLHLLIHRKQWSQAQSLLNRMRSTFPRIYEDYDSDITRLGKQIRKALADRDPKAS